MLVSANRHDSGIHSLINQYANVAQAKNDGWTVLMLASANGA